MVFRALKSSFFLHVVCEPCVDGSETFGKKIARSRITSPNFILQPLLFGFLLCRFPHQIGYRLHCFKINLKTRPDAHDTTMMYQLGAFHSGRRAQVPLESCSVTNSLLKYV